MDNHGVQTDPRTGRPVGLVSEEKAERERTLEAERLKRQSEWEGISETETGRKFIALVQERLDARIAELVQSDPEAAAYQKIIRELGVKEGLGRRATKTLMARAAAMFGKRET
jgi:hypothetical protein